MPFTWTLSITFQQTEGACGAGLPGSFEQVGSEGPAAAGGGGRGLIPASRRHQRMPILGGAEPDLGRGGISGCGNRSLRCRVQAQAGSTGAWGVRCGGLMAAF